MTVTGFAPFTNATLTFQVAGGVTVDPRTGNVIESTTAEVYNAFLKQKRPPDYLNLSGVDRQIVYLEGKLVSPQTFSSSVVPGMPAAATFQSLTGEFELLPDESLLPDYRASLFTPVRGLFRIVGQG